MSSLVRKGALCLSVTTAVVACLALPTWREFEGGREKRNRELQPAIQQGTVPPAAPAQRDADTGGLLPGNMQNAITDLESIFAASVNFRKENNGAYAKNWGDLLPIVSAGLAKGRPDTKEENKRINSEALTVFTNPDTALSDQANPKTVAESVVVYPVIYQRPDGTLVGSSKPAGSRDVISYTKIYYHRNSRGVSDGAINNPVGYLPVLWDTGQVELVPFDMAPLFSSPARKGLTEGFPGMAGLPFEAITYGEFWSSQISQEAPLGKPVLAGSKKPVRDNGGPESLIGFSRRINFPDQYGLKREKVWDTFDPGQAEFSLENVRTGAAKLGIDLAVAKLSLKQLSDSGIPAILFLADDGRCVTLTGLDDDFAVIVDRGMTRCVPREFLERRYSGMALVAAGAVGKSSYLRVEDPVRQVRVTDRKMEVLQVFKLQNSGPRAIDVEAQPAELGATEVSLSSNTIPPGGSATVSVKVRWREILKTPTQCVITDLKTSDPLCPRVQLACSLVLGAG